MTSDALAHRSITPATIVRGHRVASGLNGNPRFPGGTLRMQQPFFLARGLDLSPFHPGALNISIAPLSYRVLMPKVTFRTVKWHATEPAEDFSFFDVRLLRDGSPPIAGLIYHPHPDTKPEHFQSADVLELLLPWTDQLAYGQRIEIEVPDAQMRFEAVKAIWTICPDSAKL
jgi:hypothetical protein